MAYSGGVVNIICTHCPHGFLGGVVGFVDGSPTGDVKTHPPLLLKTKSFSLFSPQGIGGWGGGGADTRRNSLQRLIPAHSAETFFPALTHHWVRKPPQAPEFLTFLPL